MNQSEPKIVSNWDHPITLHPDDDLYKLLEVVGKENRRIGLELEELYDDRFLETATNEELRKLGKYVGIQRRTDEGDEKLRKRIQAEFIAQASDTTYSAFANAVLQIIDAPTDSVSLVTPPESGQKEVTVKVNSNVLIDSPLTKSEIANLLDKAVSADAKVNLVETGTFAFEGDDSSLEGWDEGTWSQVV